MRTVVVAALAAALCAPAAARAQAVQAAQVRYEFTSRAALLASPAQKAKVTAQIDSGTVVLVEGAEESGPAYTKVTWNGQTGWVANDMLRRIVTIRDPNPVRVADTVRVTKVDTVTKVQVDTVRKKP